MFKHKDPINAIFARIFFATIFLISSLGSLLEDTIISDIFTLDESIVGAVATSPHFYVLKVVEILLAVCFLVNFFIPTALIVATPIILSAIGYHLWLGNTYGLISLILLLPLSYLLHFYRNTFYTFFKPQMYAGNMAEHTPKVLIYDEIEEKNPELLHKFDEIYTQTH